MANITVLSFFIFLCYQLANVLNLLQLVLTHIMYSRCDRNKLVLQRLSVLICALVSCDFYAFSIFHASSLLIVALFLGRLITYAESISHTPSSVIEVNLL